MLEPALQLTWTPPTPGARSGNLGKVGGIPNSKLRIPNSSFRIRYSPFLLQQPRQFVHELTNVFEPAIDARKRT